MNGGLGAKRGVTKKRWIFLSNSGMDYPPNELAERLTELEIKSSYAEDLLEQLNMTIYRQQQQIDSLILQVAQLKQQSQNAGQDGAARNLRDELPPHY
ncbi:SlyX protein [Variovorax beijingensis]|nr:SlyX protein [Variovorax beijingensis]